MTHKIKKSPIYLVQYSILLFSLVVGCATNNSVSSRYEIPSEKPDGLAISKNVILIADNQLNYLFGDPFWMRSELTDKFVKVAIRPVQQDLFGPDILKWVLEFYGSQYPVIHLGDATNIACAGELEAFFDIMKTAKKPWVMVPGNHDFYLLGNTNSNKSEWLAACNGADGPTTKDKFIRLYLEQIQKQFDDFQRQYPDSLPMSGSWRTSSGTTTFLKSIDWKIDEGKPWRSYIVQEVDLSLPNSLQKISAILLDTTQFAIQPGLLPSPPLSVNAGVNGDIQPDQLEIIENYLKDDPTRNKITIFMSHHPFDRLLPDTMNSIDSLRKNYKVPLYISAHTHEGQYLARGGSEGWLELNVGSIVDWPIEFREFAIHDIRNNPEKLLFRMKLHRIPECWDKMIPPQAPQCDISWEAKPEDKDYYLSFTDSSSADPKETQKDLMNCMLYTYKRLFTIVPSATDNKVWPIGCSNSEEVLQRIDKAVSDNCTLKDKKDLLIELGNYDRNRMPEDPIKLRDYRLWQAVWASKYDKSGRRLPDAPDSYIIFPRR